jgi:hypothetical protein
MREQILELVKNHPRHYVKMISRHDDLTNWVRENSLVNGALSEMIFSAIHQVSGTCHNGKQQKFRSFTEGYAFCGRARDCECASESVAEKLKEYHQSVSFDSKLEIQQRRLNTVQEKYGVDNVGKTAQARAARREFYSDEMKVAESIEKNKQTKQERYGDPGYNNRVQASQTFKERYGVDYWVSRMDNENIPILRDKREMESLFSKFTPHEISQQLGVHVQTVYCYLNKHDIRSPFQSSEELAVKNYLRELGVSNIVENTRRLLPSGREIDIYIPDKQIAIEYNGVYWHHEDVPHIHKNYHHSKFVECEKLGIQLITVFSTFWKNKPEIVKSILRNKLGVNQTSVYARQCKVREISSKDTKDFLNLYHIQGYTVAPVAYGLYHSDQLTAVMTFGERRVAIGKPESGYELIRFASAGRVVGGAGKLLSAFIRNRSPERIFSYSDNEWSTGNLYARLGFSLEREIPPSYWYLEPKHEKLRHRYNYAKHKLVEAGYSPELTSREITQQMGLLKIWDCGKRKWVWKPKV